jgi:hypothetical protein
MLQLWQVFEKVLLITAFVAAMMVLVDWLNVLTRGTWQQLLCGTRWLQYLAAIALGATPGCLGAFVVVALYVHRTVSLGALVGCMIATSGDEAFVMFAMIPRQALLLNAVLVVIAIPAGVLADLLIRGRDEECAGLQVHEEHCLCFGHRQILGQLREMSPVRGILVLVLAAMLLAVASGLIGPPDWNWIRATILILTFVSLLIVATVPEHFLEDHLWRHVVRQHLPRILAWTFGALVFMHVLTDYLHLEGLIRENTWLVLLVAGLVGLIPESGPHLVFLTLYVEGAIPVSILLASSIVQDGHGMLPMLAHSRRTFIQIKLINLGVGLVVGAAGLSLGF